MSEHISATGSEDPDLSSVLAGIGAVVLPFARMYLGPASSRIERTGEQQLLLFALHKFVVEAGTLPAPGAAYAPHEGTFAIDSDGHAPALDLRYVLAALRGLSAWASAGPQTAQAAESSAKSDEGTATEKTSQPVSARALRTSARTAGYGTASAPAPRRGGCGCGGAAAYEPAATAYRATYSTAASRRTRTRSAAGDPKRSCDCGGTCGGSGCGCAGTDSCTDCMPRETAAGTCACASCKPAAPETCDPWTLSCATRNRLKACLKDVLCELLLCVEEYLCPTTKVDAQVRRTRFLRCLYELLCKLLRCIREALCPPPKPVPSPQRPIDCLPCSYAVEEPR